MAWPPVLFPAADTIIVLAVRAALAARGDTATVASIVPNPRPDRLITVHRTGGPRRDHVTDNPLLTVQCWAPADTDAHDLAQIARAVIGALRGTSSLGVAVYAVHELSGPALFPEPNSALPRYTFTVQVALRGSTLT